MASLRVNSSNSIISQLFSKNVGGKCLFSSYAISHIPHPKPERYGVPSLQKTIEKYLEYSKPLVSPAQWDKTSQIASNFLLSPNVTRLQSLLEQRSKMEDNWLFDWWLSTYLTYRAPVIINSNPGMRMQTMSFKTDYEWLAHATGIICGVLNYKARLESKKLGTEFSNDGASMCMVQYYALLGNCRIPGSPHDRLLSRRGNPHMTKDINHICVLYRNRVYKLEFSDAVTLESLSPKLIYRQLEHIVSKGRDLPPGPPVGLLTCLPRDNWSTLHSQIRQSVANANILSALERSLFILCLDDSAQLSDASATEPSDAFCVLDPRETKSSENLLHGNLFNSGNRWFDKSVQFVVSRDGSVGCNFEHTAADAGALVPMVSDVYAAIGDPVSQSDTRLPVFAYPKELIWYLPGLMMGELEQASDTVKTLLDTVELQYGVFQKFGSASVKQIKSSPDAFFQLALQLAYARLHPDQLPPPTYESGSLRRFHLGRTDTIRSCSQESVQFSQSMQDPKSSPSERSQLLRKALKQHQDFTSEVTAGKAFDRHLLGLRLLVSLTHGPTVQECQEAFDLFADPTYAQVQQYKLSTSQVRSPNDLATVFGPGVPDGYGVCYNIHRDAIQISATSYRTSSLSESPSKILLQTSSALCDMHELLSGESA